MGTDGVHNVQAGVAAQVVQARDIGTVTFLAPQAPASIPALVPPGPAAFVDRVEHLAAVRSLIGAEPTPGRPVVVAVRGMPGVGKTALVRQVATVLAADFPDGSLHATFGVGGESPSEALGRLLKALGVPDASVPTDFRRRRDLYRSLTARTRLITVLDDVTDAGQVEALLPNSAAGLVLVASNTALEDLHADGAVPLVVEPLEINDALDLLRQVCADGRVDRDPAAAAELVDLCGRLPLAIRAAGARLAVRPRWALARLVEELRGTEADRVLDRVNTVFDTVYADLPPRARAVYRVLGLLVGRDFCVEVVAAVVDEPVAEVRELLDQLATAALVEERADDRYAVHRLVRAHALRVADEHTTGHDRENLLLRAVDWWLFGATAADVAATGRERLRVADPDRLLSGVELTMSPHAALAWFDREHTNIAAAMRACAEKGWHTLVWQLFEATFAYYDARRPLASWVETGILAVESSVVDGDVAAEARCRCLLAKAYQELERYDLAESELDKARALPVGDRLQGSTYDFTGNLALRTGDFEDALHWFTMARDINVRLDRKRGTAMQTLFVGRALAGLGRTAEALTTFTEAAGLALDAGAHSVLAKAFLATAAAHSTTHHHAEADQALAEAERIAHELDNTALQAEIHLLRATTATTQGDLEAAHSHRQAAAAAYERMGSPKAARLLAGH
ncbi:tetratricopeptide (TPR) repeat protein [Actinokineospora baliensis]|uniref:NB-ARC domain-containing protein n=1 Tax=Actinokineospora baliensis TaxID=547056 RepID=UPI0027DE6A78|nr:NB-ARC domain-containing protein [Actinokineospora baliensis]MBM7773215.1 tetratricopeptide (TPR) repeat protein [Actinokineospora baliensis]